MPGSEQAVRKIQQITLRNKITGNIGTIGLRCSTKYGQLKYHSNESILFLKVLLECKEKTRSETDE
jgi:hypothetical protein